MQDPPWTCLVWEQGGGPGPTLPSRQGMAGAEDEAEPLPETGPEQR